MVCWHLFESPNVDPRHQLDGSDILARQSPHLAPDRPALVFGALRQNRRLDHVDGRRDRSNVSSPSALRLVLSTFFFVIVACFRFLIAVAAFSFLLLFTVHLKKNCGFNVNPILERF